MALRVTKVWVHRRGNGRGEIEVISGHREEGTYSGITSRDHEDLKIIRACGLLNGEYSFGIIARSHWRFLANPFYHDLHIHYPADGLDVGRFVHIDHRV